MHFETEKEAQMFLKYNGDEIYKETGRKPIRAYYCDVCVAWHITSMENFYVESSYKVLEHKYHYGGANSVEMQILRTRVKELQDMYNRGLYKIAVEKAVEILRPLTKSLYIDEWKRRVLLPCYDIIDRCFVILLAPIKEHIKKEEFIGGLLDEIALVHSILQKTHNGRDARLNAIFTKYTKEIRALRSKVNEHNVEASMSASMKILDNWIKQANNQYQANQYIMCIEKAVSAIKALYDCTDVELTKPRENIYHEICALLINSAIECFSMIDSYIEKHELEKARFEIVSLSEQLVDSLGDYRSDEYLNKVVDECHKLLRNRHNKIRAEECGN